MGGGRGDGSGVAIGFGAKVSGVAVDDFGFQLWVLSFGDKNQFGNVLHGGGDSRGDLGFCFYLGFGIYYFVV